ncbi:hypothetical protein, partial [Methylocapsa sp. S129]|uniref:hypothetical protein n=1 Tax=Methylocapsa sp. S129 TaxID=1641869 RepID=UPI00131B8759
CSVSTPPLPVLPLVTEPSVNPPPLVAVTSVPALTVDQSIDASPDGDARLPAASVTLAVVAVTVAPMFDVTLVSDA